MYFENFLALINGLQRYSYNPILGDKVQIHLIIGVL